MSDLLCPICKKPLGPDPRAKFCSDKCRWRGYWKRSVRSAEAIDELPITVLPAEAEEILPAGSDRSHVAMQLALISRAPAGARGYRLGIKHGLSQIQRWFPIAKHKAVPMFLLDPFEEPAVPVAGSYAVVYLDVHCVPIGGPRFAVGVDEVDRRVCYSHGDRSFRPKLT